MTRFVYFPPFLSFSYVLEALTLPLGKQQLTDEPSINYHTNGDPYNTVCAVFIQCYHFVLLWLRWRSVIDIPVRIARLAFEIVMHSTNSNMVFLLYFLCL